MKYSSNSIVVNFIKDHRYFLVDKIDNTTENLSYLERLAAMEDRIYYDYTCRNLTELINSPVKWGVDNTGKVFNLSNLEQFKTSLKTIRKVKPGLIWLNRISYPLTVEKTLNLEEVDTKVLKVIVVYIDYVWTIYKFTYDTKIKEYIRL